MARERFASCLSVPAGMQAFYEVNSCDSETGAAKGGALRIHYLAAEKVQWNYAPSGKDMINNVSLIEAERWAESFFRL